MISTQETTMVVRNMLAAFDQQDRERFGNLIADDAQWVSHATGHVFRGPAEMTHAAFTIRTAFPDLYGEFVQTFATEDHEVAEIVWIGTHTVDLVTAAGTVPATGKRITWNDCYIVSVKDGKIAGVSQYYDTASFYAQLGVQPPSKATEANKMLLRRFYEEIFDQGNLSAAEELVAPTFVDHVPQPLPGQPTSGSHAVTWLATQFRMAIPDVQVTVDELLASGDKVLARVTWNGTHTGSFMGIDPTGKHFKVKGIDLVRIDDGKIVEHWGQIDVLDIIGQLGWMPML
jgi:steroid delta-isomerase-like uncharacterized protein